MYFIPFFYIRIVKSVTVFCSIFIWNFMHLDVNFTIFLHLEYVEWIKDKTLVCFFSIILVHLDVILSSFLVHPTLQFLHPQIRSQNLVVSELFLRVVTFVILSSQNNREADRTMGWGKTTWLRLCSVNPEWTRFPFFFLVHVAFKFWTTFLIRK
jgi:hypothetical protein